MEARMGHPKARPVSDGFPLVSHSEAPADGPLSTEFLLRHAHRLLRPDVRVAGPPVWLMTGALARHRIDGTEVARHKSSVAVARGGRRCYPD
jgi:hypothetical protein